MMPHFSPENFLKKARNQAEYAGLRYVREKTSHRAVRNEQTDHNSWMIDEGVMIEVLADGHFGYAATADLSEAGLNRALEAALRETKAASVRKAFSFDLSHRPVAVGSYQSQRQKPLDQASLAELTDLLIASSKAMKASDQIVSRQAMAMIVETTIEQFSTHGSSSRQNFDIVSLHVGASASNGTETQTRSLNGWNARSWQIGAEVFDRAEFVRESERIGREALELLSAENCPSETCDLILMPDQMMLQIHESIGHPLELDRILGDERNYAGWSFVKPDDFGNLQYGSELMNVSFDPHREGEIASYKFDDGGTPAERKVLIEKGKLLRGLGSLESQTRSKIPGVANFRSASWNRAPIDRMANINLEPGKSSLDDLIGSVQNGVLMEANRSWSIDDYRNKFQFGCEYGKRIKDGRIVGVVKNPNYRGTTVAFWNKLAGVGSKQETFGTPYCGKGEPNQVIRVGHASPPCLFRDVEVFGGHS